MFDVSQLVLEQLGGIAQLVSLMNTTAMQCLEAYGSLVIGWSGNMCPGSIPDMRVVKEPWSVIKIPWLLMQSTQTVLGESYKGVTSVQRNLGVCKYSGAVDIAKTWLHCWETSSHPLGNICVAAIKMKITWAAQTCHLKSYSFFAMCRSCLRGPIVFVATCGKACCTGNRHRQRVAVLRVEHEIILLRQALPLLLLSAKVLKFITILFPCYTVRL